MKLSTQIFLGFLIIISIDLLDSYVNYSLTLKVNTNTAFLTNSESIIRNSGQLNKGMVDMQSAFRGFLLTDDKIFLLPYTEGLKKIPLLISQEDKLLNTSSSQRHKLNSILLLHNLWISYANSLIAAKNKAKADPKFVKQYKNLFDNQFTQQVGKSYNDQIATIFQSFDQYEYKVREERRKALARSIKQTERFSLLFSTLTIIIGLSSTIYLVKKISQRIDSMVKLAETITQGDFARIEDNKNDELSGLSVSLNSMSDKLSRNIKDLEKKNDELNQFAYVVSHDLKAPVRGIYNVIQWIDEDLHEEISPKMREFLDIIPERIKRMEDLIDGLLNYARISRLKPIQEEVDLKLLIKEIAEEIVPKDYNLIFKNLPKISTEKLLIKQVFSNLISNAVKYAPITHGEIVIASVENEYFYEFTVKDNGIGIDQEYHEKIFVIFQTLREKHDKESTGIGLAIVKKIIDEKRGTIRVISSEGKGASFIFTWPKNKI